ncbi:MAG: S-methyl-5-thioribose-1-phosphate isomerase, partial [Halobacteriota archaeon]
MDREFTEKLTIFWHDGAIMLVDQTKLPIAYKLIKITTINQLIIAINKLKIRGAPALGAAGAYGIALAAHNSTARTISKLKTHVHAAARSI